MVLELFCKVIHRAAEHAGVPGQLHVAVQHFAGALGVAHAAKHAAVRAGDALDGVHGAVGVEQDIHAGFAVQVHVLGGDLAVLGQLLQQLLVGHEAALAVGDRDGEHVADV